MRCVVTGGAGFIGSHLVERLLTDGHTVHVIDNLSTGRKENLAFAEGNPALRVVVGDISDPANLTDIFDGAEWVFHLAALADIVPSIQQPLAYHRSNVEGTVAVLEAARAAGVRRFIYAASSSCYGIPDAYPTREDAAPRPMYPYALTKYVGEQYVLHWAQLYKLPAVALRLFNVYGPRARTSGTYGAVFGVFLAQLLANKPLTVVGDGTQTRDFTYVTDVVDAFVKAADSNETNRAFNVGTGTPVSVNRLVELLRAPSVVHIPKRPGEPDCTHADATAIRQALGWEPQVPVELGVAHLLRQIDYWREAPLWTPENISQATKDWFKYLA